MRNQTKKYIQQLQNVMHSLSLWQSIPPVADAFLSEEPFSIDTMSAQEWLQWVLLSPLIALEELLKNQ